jgi:eukaryotic-like serine/threonine-protein kinase
MPRALDDDLLMTVVMKAMASPPEQRQAWLATTCALDTQLYDEAQKYVTWEERMQGFLLQPLCSTPASERSFEPGEILHRRFHIVREVARGGMGVVYEAVDARLERRIALKCAKAGYRRRLPPEVRHASEISHPNVCKIFEIHTAETSNGDVDFLTMEFLDGETLARRIAREPLTDEHARTIALQLCDGLAAAHRRKVIHGDLKSNNVIITTETDGALRAVITDFGLARGPEAAQKGEQSGETGGTPDYMAPELWAGGKASVASDIYALGVMLEELASGKHAPTRQERLAGKLPSVPARWSRVIRRCLDPDPVRRFQRAEDVAQALRPVSRRMVVGAAAAAMLAVVSGLVTYQTTTAPQENVRLAVLPFTGALEVRGAAEDVTRSAGDQLRRLRNGGRTRITLIPLATTVRNKVSTVEAANSLLGATHVLHGRVKRDGEHVTVQAFLTDSRSGVQKSAWKAAYAPSELRHAKVALAGFVTGSFHLRALVEIAAVNAAARQDYMTGVHLLRRNSTIDNALTLLERAVAADRDSPLTHAALAEAQWWKYFLTTDKAWLHHAAASVREAERRNPDLAEVHRAAGIVQATSGWYDQAEAHYLRAIELDPGNSDAYRRLGNIYHANNNREKALAVYRRAVELEPEQYRNHQALGSFYNEHAEYLTALKHFQKTVDLAPTEPIAHFVLGTVLLTLGKFAESERELRLALDLGETQPALNTLGVVLTYLRRDQEATTYYRRALERYPEQYSSWMNLATAYRHLQLARDAERANRRGIELAEAEMRNNPKSGYIRACLAYMSAWVGDRTRADFEIAQALQLSPTDSNVRRMAVKTYEALGRRRDALDVLSGAGSDVLAHVSGWPDLADLRADSRFIQMMAASQSR